MIDGVIKGIRIKHNLTQKDLADLLFVSDKTVSSWENNRTIPDIYILEKISTLFSIPMNSLMQGDISRYAILKFKIKQKVKAWGSIIKSNWIMILWVMILLIGFGLSLAKWPLVSMITICLIMGGLIINIGFKRSRWHLMGLFIWLSFVIPNIIALIYPAQYGVLIEKNTQHFLQSIWIYGFLLLLGAYLVFLVFQVIHKKKISFSQWVVIITQVIWWVVVYFVYKIVKLSMVYSSWTQQWTSTIVQSSSSFVYLSLVYLIFCTLMIFNQYTKGDSQ